MIILFPIMLMTESLVLPHTHTHVLSLLLSPFSSLALFSMMTEWYEMYTHMLNMHTSTGRFKFYWYTSQNKCSKSPSPENRVCLFSVLIGLYLHNAITSNFTRVLGLRPVSVNEHDSTKALLLTGP